MRPGTVDRRHARHVRTRARSPNAAPRHTAAVDFARCVRAWGGLVARMQLRSPKEYVGTHLHFRDGTTSLVFRETVRRAPTLEPALLVIQFRLAVLGSNRWAHAAFRRECVLHTPLFAGFPGFRSKLWADDVATGIYRGVYEWDGAEAPRDAPGWSVCWLPSQTPTRRVFMCSEVFAAKRSFAIHRLSPPMKQMAGGNSNSPSSRVARPER